MDKRIKKYAERYKYDVLRRLHPADRLSAEAELDLIIKEKLSFVSNIDEMEIALKDLGHPIDVAKRFRKRERFLVFPFVEKFTENGKKDNVPERPFISSNTFEIYLNALIVFLFIAVGTCLFESFMHFIKSFFSENISTSFIINFLTNLFSIKYYFFEIILAFFLVVTLVFFFVDRDSEKNKKVFKLSSLPQIPDSYTGKIGRVNCQIALFFNLLFGLLLILLLTDCIPIVYENGRRWKASFVFQREFIEFIFPIICLCLLLETGINISKIIINKWNFAVSISAFLEKLIVWWLLFLTLTRKTVFTEKFVTYIKSLPWKIQGDSDILKRISAGDFSQLRYWILTLISFFLLIDMFTTVYGYLQYRRNRPRPV